MKRLFLSILILITTVSYAQVKADDELVKRTEEWFKNNPNSMPHWMTPDELERINEVGKGFIETAPPIGPVRQTAEFERMQSVLVRYPFGIPVDLIKEMSLVTDVVTIVATTTERTTVINTYVSAGIDTSRCEFMIAPTESYWTRDYGPWYVVNGDNEVSICDFVYNRPRPGDDDVAVQMSSYLSEPLYGMRVVHTGGNYMTDGMGIGASTDIVYTESYSQQGITSEQVDQMMNDYLGIHTYHVVDDPNNTYIDHIDCWGKFLDVDKILIREVPGTHPQYDELEATAAYFASQKSSYGNNYQIYRVNTPNDEPYSNSLILNDHVFVPIMNSSNDAAALSVYQNAMPGYTIVPVPGLSSPYEWQSTDALHCRTRGVVDKEMLHIYHVAKVFDQSPLSGTEIKAKIVSYGGHDIQSASLFYKINGGVWNSVQMTSSQDEYTAVIPQQPSGSSVSYYIRAEDSSGRIETHPFIGPSDPHNFSVSDIPVIAVSVSDTLFVQSQPGGSSTETIIVSNAGTTDLNYSMNFIYSGLKESQAHSNDFENGFSEYTTSGTPLWTVTSGMTVNCAKIVATSNRISTSVLTSPVFDGSNYNSLILEFDQLASKNSSEATVFQVEYSDGISWTEVYSINFTTDASPMIIIPSTSEDMQLRFTASTATRSGIDSWSIDNIVLKGQENYLYDWLRLDGGTSVSGAVTAGSGNDTDVNINADGMPKGEYFSNIIISSNDPNNPIVSIPVKLTVSDALSAPLNITILSVTSTTVGLSWDPVTGASVYNIYRSNLPYSGFEFIGSSVTETYTDANISSGNKYFYYITSGDGK